MRRMPRPNPRVNQPIRHGSRLHGHNTTNSGVPESRALVRYRSGSSASVVSGYV